MQRRMERASEPQSVNSAAQTEAQHEFFSKLAPELSERFSDVFSRIPQDTVNELVSGKLYTNFAGLSERIWNYRGKFNRDIGAVINYGIAAKNRLTSWQRTLRNI